MNDILSEVIKQVPALGVLAWIVWTFLNQMSKRDKNLEAISEGCHRVQRDAIVAIRENSKVLGETMALLRRLNGKVKKK